MQDWYTGSDPGVVRTVELQELDWFPSVGDEGHSDAIDATLTDPKTGPLTSSAATRSNSAKGQGL